jgi:hypothetical protein
MESKFKIVEMKRVSDQWEIKTKMPDNMFGFSSITMKVEAEVPPAGGGAPVDRELSDVFKTLNRRIAYDLQRLANIAFEGLDKDSSDMVRRVLLDEASHDADRSSDVR